MLYKVKADIKAFKLSFLIFESDDYFCYFLKPHVCDSS